MNRGRWLHQPPLITARATGDDQLSVGEQVKQQTADRGGRFRFAEGQPGKTSPLRTPSSLRMLKAAAGEITSPTKPAQATAGWQPWNSLNCRKTQHPTSARRERQRHFNEYQHNRADRRSNLPVASRIPLLFRDRAPCKPPGLARHTRQNSAHSDTGGAVLGCWDDSARLDG